MLRIAPPSIPESAVSSENTSSQPTATPPGYAPSGYTPPEWIKAEAEKLKGDVLRAAIEGQVTTYPQVVRTMMDPFIPGQSHGNLSFMLFDKPKVSKTGKPIYGFVKLRGNWMDPRTSQAEAAKIVKNVDSKFPVKIVQVGSWVPITEDDSFVKDMVDVKAAEGQPQLRDEAIKKKEDEAKEKMKQLRDREEQLRKDGDIIDDPTSIRYYTMKRVTEMKVVEMIDTMKKKLEDLEGKLTLIRDEMCTLESSHPTYGEEWIECYNQERAKSGIPAFLPAEKQFSGYEAHKLSRNSDTIAARASS